MKYFVLSEGEFPTRLLFDEDKAKEAGAKLCNPYLDAFDADGNHVQTMKYVREPGSQEGAWTTQF